MQVAWLISMDRCVKSDSYARAYNNGDPKESVKKIWSWKVLSAIPRVYCTYCQYILADELDPSVLLSKCLYFCYCNSGHIYDEIYMRNDYASMYNT